MTATPDRGTRPAQNNPWAASARRGNDAAEVVGRDDESATPAEVDATDFTTDQLTAREFRESMFGPEHTEPPAAPRATIGGNNRRFANNLDSALSATAGGSSAGPDGEDIHPLLPGSRWADLVSLAPELATAIDVLDTVSTELQSFNRPMGPEEAVTLLDGIETMSRVLQSMSVSALSVFERVGTPRDFGAASTRALIQDRLGLSWKEARDRAELASVLGRRVDLTGQPLAPKYELCAQALSAGELSTIQAKSIADLLAKFPTHRVGEQARHECEDILVTYAPKIRVRDLKTVFDKIVAWIDPDGDSPAIEHDRDDYEVRLRVRSDGTWDLAAHLDEITGGILNGFLISRNHSASADNGSAPDNGSREATGTDTQATGTDTQATGTDTQATGIDGTGTDTSEETASAAASGESERPHRGSARPGRETVYTEVLSGERMNARDIATSQSGAATSATAADGPAFIDWWGEDDEPTIADVDRVPDGYGVREDGTLADTSLAQPTVKNRIYERFAGIIAEMEKTRISTGSPFSLVVMAKAEDIADGNGYAQTGAENPFPMSIARNHGLHGRVFFNLMSDKARTVDVVTENRFASAKQLAIITARDRGCSFPGCNTEPGFCDAHHIVPWSEGGRTSINNLTLACGRHHRMIDKTDWHTIMLADGRPAWVPPAALDHARRPILHARFIVGEIEDTLFDK